jgi:predicted protein tyrosine phosphatase
MREVVIASRPQVEYTALALDVPMVSIRCPGNMPVYFKGMSDRKPPAFMDTVFEDSEIHGAIPLFEVKRIFEFLEAHQQCDVIVVQCEAGRSRSAAVALFCAERYGAEVDMRGKAPNLRLVEMLRHCAQVKDMSGE